MIFKQHPDLNLYTDIDTQIKRNESFGPESKGMVA
jgi:hypothetical protein